MKTILWDNLIDKIARTEYTRASANEGFGNMESRSGVYALLMCMEESKTNWKENTQALANAVYERIMHWDVRMAKKLLDLFPYGYPKGCQNSKISATYDEKGRWCLIFH